MPNKYEEAIEVRKIAKPLVENRHTHLQDAKILYLFREKAWKSKGELTFGQATKLGGKTKALSGIGYDHDGFDFLIEIAKKEFEQMEKTQKEALVNHELCHCIKDENGKWKTVNHDFEGFRSELKDYGFWTNKLQFLKRDLKQMSLFEEHESKAQQELIS